MKFKNSMKKLSIKEVLLIIQATLLPILFGGRGSLWTFNQDTVIHDSPFYARIHEVMPIWVWGTLIMIASLIYLLSALYVTSMQYNNKFYWYTLIGAGSSAFFYFIMTSASLYNNINWLTPFNFLLYTVWMGIIAFISGAEIYARRK